MKSQIQIGGMAVEVVRKNIKNVHLSVHPPVGRVTISAPIHMELDTIRVFAVAKVGWIRQQQALMQSQDRETPREIINCESHYVWGERYLMKVIESDVAASISLNHKHIIVRVRPAWHEDKRHELLDSWYRVQLAEALPGILQKWEKKIGVEVNGFFVRRMKTKWGSCNPHARTIRLNTDLAKKPRECLEYVVVHELVHLLEPSHNDRFVQLMDRYMPKWQSHRQLLNSLPVRHESWAY
jgi:predicted metal-dependent hydrolase